MKGKRHPVGLGMAPTKTDFGKFLRGCRLSLGLSQAEVARCVGVCQTEYSAFETGAVKYVNPKYIKGLARSLRYEAANLNAVAPRKPLAKPRTDKGRLILARREELGLSRKDLAQRLKIGVRAVRVFELGGYQRVTPQTAWRLAEALELKVSAFRDFIWFKGKEPISGLGKLVRDRRHERGLSQRQLAARLGKTYQLVSLIETGKISLSRLSCSTLANLARLLNLNIITLEGLRPPRKLKKIKTKPNSLGAFAFGRRTKLGLTQSALGRRGGLSPTTVSDIERGMCRPKPRVLAKMQTALGCEIPPNLVSAAGT